MKDELQYDAVFRCDGIEEIPSLFNIYKNPVSIVISGLFGQIPSSVRHITFNARTGYVGTIMLNKMGYNRISMVSPTSPIVKKVGPSTILDVNDLIGLKMLVNGLNHWDYLSYLPRNLQKLSVSLGNNPRYNEYYFSNFRFIILLPSSIRKLTINNPRSRFLMTQLPRNITHIKLQYYCGNSLDGLPNTLEVLRISKKYNGNVDSLPENLKVLEIGDDFNKPIDHLPSKLDVLILGKDFNQSVDHLPPNLTILSLIGSCEMFNQSNISESFGPVINCTSRNGSFDQSLEKLPGNLKKLFIPGSTTHNINMLPQSLVFYFQSSRFQWKTEDLPCNITHLCLEDRSIVTPDCTDGRRFLGSLPPKLTHLKLSGHIPSSFPDTLTFFQFGNVFPYDIFNIALPPATITLVCDELFVLNPPSRIYEYVKTLRTVKTTPLSDSVLVSFDKQVKYYFPACIDFVSKLSSAFQN